MIRIYTHFVFFHRLVEEGQSVDTNLWKIFSQNSMGNGKGSSKLTLSTNYVTLWHFSFVLVSAWCRFFGLFKFYIHICPFLYTQTYGRLSHRIPWRMLREALISAILTNCLLKVYILRFPFVTLLIMWCWTTILMGFTKFSFHSCKLKEED